jgi:integrase/recombinase XerD
MSSSIEKYLQGKGLSKATIKCYCTEILEFIAWCDGQNIESEQASSTDIADYLKHLQRKGQHNKTRNINLNIIKHYYNYVIHIEAREDNPARQIKLRGTKAKKLYPILSKQELEAIYHHYTLQDEQSALNNRNWFSVSQLSRKRNKAILSLMIYQGLATDEVNRLMTKDVKLKEGKIFIAGTRKSNERELDLKSHQVMELMEYQLSTRVELLKLRVSKEPSDLYFLPTPQAGSKTASEHSGIHIWKRLSQDVKTKNKKFINFLQVRTSVITLWLQQHNLRQVQYMAGHRYVSTTEGYLVNNMEDLQKDVEQYHPIG